MNIGRSTVWASVRHWAIPVAVAALLVVTAAAGDHPATGIGAAAYALLAVSGLVLAVARRAPVLALIVTGLCAVGYQAAGFDIAAVAYLFAVYAAVRAGRRVIAAAASLAMIAALPLAALASGVQDTGDAFTQGRNALELAWLIAAAAAGEALRQAERRADEAERSREAAARRRADEERLHIARELHDSLTHQISVIKVQAEVAVHLSRKAGAPVPEALLAIQSASREASRELRATLEALRDDDTRPPRGIGDIPELVERARALGLDATLSIDGEPYTVPEALGRTAYRIVQEALTNTARHGAATSATVGIGYRPDLVAVTVDDDGEAAPGGPPVPGIGLLGMRERVTALGGSLHARPRDDGGFRVEADLPVDRAA
ncbi:sensor histidine kinase [Glycomyces harbinensis]|uniref:histidine kinase n=1 Tax=Glycomyces harbinensis TaxID=58114 RepID=A0A1G7ASZ2_9ACTN|nr:histidine kinase [Glycomyces harbinensis]SDE17046.1 Signal transduction histidine kinase [Glycomyces harbinensis]